MTLADKVEQHSPRNELQYAEESSTSSKVRRSRSGLVLIVAGALVLPIPSFSTTDSTAYAPVAGIIAGCDDGGDTSNNQDVAALITSAPDLYIEEATEYASANYNTLVTASGNPTPSFQIVQAPAQMTWANQAMGELYMPAIGSVLGEYPLEIQAQNSAGSDQQLWTLKVVYNYENSGNAADSRATDWISAGRYDLFDCNFVTPKQYQFASNNASGSTFVDGQIVKNNPGGKIEPVIFDYVGRTGLAEDIADLEAVGWEPVVIDMHTSESSHNTQFDDALQNSGFGSPP